MAALQAVPPQTKPGRDPVQEVKRMLAAPCGFLSHSSKTGGPVTVYPGVNCAFGCDACGWNPEEKKRRLKTGHWEEVRSFINPETGKREALPEGTKQLRFIQARK